MIGTGGIGSGMFFALQGNHTLGREESRAGIFLDRRDYCKLHIISHYVKVLLGSEFHTILAGKVGDDSVGQALIDEMKQTGLDVRHVQVCPGCRTLLSVCFTYPDGSGGNLTAADSASDQVDAAAISALEPDFIRFAGHGIALAAPEVPLEARLELLSLATRYRFFRAGAFVTAEISRALQMGLLDMLDLVGLNIDEAAAAADVAVEQRPTEEIVKAAVGRLARAYPHLRISVTAGKEGSWSWDGSVLAHRPAAAAEVVSTAGAGDAHLAGLIAGHAAAGLTLPQAQELAGLVASLSVTSPHTIAPEVDRDSLREFAQRSGISLGGAVLRLLDHHS
jgi:ribokinase